MTAPTVHPIELWGARFRMGQGHDAGASHCACCYIIPLPTCVCGGFIHSEEGLDGFAYQRCDKCGNGYVDTEAAE